MKKFFVLLLAVMAMSFMCTSCLFIRPYDKPEYVSIGTNETAFLINQLGTDNDQAKINANQDYKTVNSKLTRINHHWVKTGRMPGTGKYQYRDTQFIANVKANSGIDCYNRIVDYLRERVDERSQFPSAKGKNFKFRYLGMAK